MFAFSLPRLFRQAALIFLIDPAEIVVTAVAQKIRDFRQRVAAPENQRLGGVSLDGVNVVRDGHVRFLVKTPGQTCAFHPHMGGDIGGAQGLMLVIVDKFNGPPDRV